MGCNQDTIIGEWDITCDQGLNKYEGDDIKDLTLTNMGEAGRETALGMDIIVMLIIFAFVIGILGVIVYKAKKLGNI